MGMAGQERRYDIDWLRVLAMRMIFFFHCARFFDRDGWHVKNPELSFGFTVFVAVVDQFIMPLFFLLSAMSTWYALGRRTNREYLGERFKRLVVPLIFGTFVIVPPQVYLERFSQGQFNGSFFRFLPHYCDGFYGFGGNFPWMGLHLWYLEMLFLFSLITLPLFRFLRTGSGQGFVSQVAGLCAKPGGILLFVIPIALMEMLVNIQPKGIGFRDFGGWSPFTYLVFFLLGAVMSADPRFRKGVERGMIPALALLIVTTIAGYLLLTPGLHRARRPLRFCAQAIPGAG
jgi:peptidoglycan/LPS O-acetylase OafA/YrhL